MPIDDTPLIFCRLARFENTSKKFCELAHEAFFRANTFVIQLPTLPKFRDRSDAEWCQQITQPLAKASRATADIYALQECGFRFLHTLSLARTWLRRVELRPRLLVAGNFDTMFRDSGWKLFIDFARNSKCFNHIQFVDLVVTIINTVSYRNDDVYDVKVVDALMDRFRKALMEKKITIWADKCQFRVEKHSHVAWEDDVEWRDEIEDLMEKVSGVIYEGFEVEDP